MYVNRYLLWASLVTTLASVVFGFVVTSGSAAASSPSADWSSFHFFTSSARVRNYTGYSIENAIDTWDEETIWSPLEVISGSYISIYSTYDNMIGLWGWLYGAWHDFTLCASYASGDTGSCNHTTNLANSAGIYYNTYYSPVGTGRDWLFAHELGHAFGLKHHSGGLMNASYTSTYNMSHVDDHIDYWY